MRTKFTPLTRIFTPALLVMLMLILVIACKKKDDDPTPTPTPPVPPNPENPVVFSDQPLNLKTAWETTHGKKFSALNVRSLGRAFTGGEDPEIPGFSEVGKTLWEIHDYIHTEHEFKKIDDDLNTLMQDATELANAISELASQIQMQTTTIEKYFTDGLIATWISNINYQYSHTDPGVFGYFTYVGSQYEEDSATWAAAMQQSSVSVASYANAVYFSPAGTQQMGLAIQQIHDRMLSTTPADSGGLMLCAQALANDGADLINDNPANSMVLYQMLENYFLWCVTAQYQAETILLNCAYELDPADTMQYYNTTLNDFQGKLNDEVLEFLEATNYLVVNCDDYKDRFNTDFAYADAGLAPDVVWGNVLARSQMVANAIFDGLYAGGTDYTYPIICGRIITPSINNLGTTPSNSPITLSISNTQYTFNPVAVKSWMPYTTWTAGNPATCDYDDTWNIYSIGNMSQPVNQIVWNPYNPTESVSVVFTDANTPWTHNTAATGNVTVKFYNPQDLSDVSATPDPTHSMPFGFFSVNWKWGYLYLKYNSENELNCESFFSEQLQNYNNSNHAGTRSLYACNQASGDNWQGATTPFVIGCSSNWDVCTQPFSQHFYTSGIGYSEVGYNGPAFGYTGGQVCYVYNVAQRVVAPKMIGSNTAWFVASGKSWYNFGNQLNMNCGIGYTTMSRMPSGTNVCSHNLFQFDNKNPGGNYAAGSGYGLNFSANQQQEFNFGFDLFMNKIAPSYNLQVKCNLNAQVIFGGFTSESAP